MSAVSDITARLDLAQVAGVLGTDQATASQAVEEALTSLVGTMDANVGDPATALSLTRALGDHAGAAPFDVDAVDTADGAKIIQHVYSADQIQSLSPGVGGDLVRTLLPILAPLVMNYLAGKLTDYLSQSAGSAAQQPAGVPSDQGGLGDLLGGILGGGSGGGLGDLLGGILGGSLGQPSSPTTSPQVPASTGEGTFRVPTPGQTSLTPASGTAEEPRSEAAGGSGSGDLLGGILSDLLRGRS